MLKVNPKSAASTIEKSALWALTEGKDDEGEGPDPNEVWLETTGTTQLIRQACIRLMLQAASCMDAEAANISAFTHCEQNGTQIGFIS